MCVSFISPSVNHFIWYCVLRESRLNVIPSPPVMWCNVPRCWSSESTDTRLYQCASINLPVASRGGVIIHSLNRKSGSVGHTHAGVYLHYTFLIWSLRVWCSGCCVAGDSACRSKRVHSLLERSQQGLMQYDHSRTVRLAVWQLSNWLLLRFLLAAVVGMTTDVTDRLGRPSVRHRENHGFCT